MIRMEGASDKTVKSKSNCNVTAISSGLSVVPRFTPIFGKGTVWDCCACKSEKLYKKIRLRKIMGIIRFI